MIDRFFRFISSYRASIILLLIYSIGLAGATLLEKQFGAEAAKMLIYYSPLFIFLQLLIVVNFILTLANGNYIKQKKWAYLVIHFAFIIIMSGALTTFIFGKEGQIHIREGERSSQLVMHTSKGVKTETLPFELELRQFRLNRYPGSQSPSSYESDLIVHSDGKSFEANVYMNNVLDVKGYRFFQASYDEDELGTILSVNKDVAGRNITYAGYIVLVVGFILMFFIPNSRFRKLTRQLNEVNREIYKVKKDISKVSLLLLFTLIPNLGFAQQQQFKNNIPKEHAELFGSIPIQFRGRVMPMNTFSSEILRKVHKETTFENLNSDQFLLNLLAVPQMWMEIPFISVSNDQISRRYNLSEGYVSYRDLFDQNGNYILLPQLHHIHQHSRGNRTSEESDLLKLDERINILFQLFNYQMPALFPDANDLAHTWYAPGENLTSFSERDSIFVSNTFGNYLLEVRNSITSGNWSKPNELLSQVKEFQLNNDKASLINPDKLKAEIRYNNENIFSKARTLYFILGLLLLIFALLQMLQGKTWHNKVVSLLFISIILVFIYHIYGMGLRWYISGYAPWSNSYETMVYVALATVLAGLIFGRNSKLTLALATLFGGVILFVSGLNWMDPQINTLVPVLNSPWLMFHVAVIVAAYGFFGISFLLGILNLIIMSFYKAKTFTRLRIKELSIINNLSLMIGLALMTVGTFLGAVWANESWGRYWGWDPKETWALITIIAYTIVTHLYLVKRLNNLWVFNLLSVVSFSSVLMTYFGVNYFLSGMHSYGQTEGISSVFVYIGIAFGIVVIIGFISFSRKSSFEELRM